MDRGINQIDNRLVGTVPAGWFGKALTCSLLPLLLCCALPFVSRSQLQQFTTPAHKHIYGIGNSVMADRSLTSPTRGWMQLLPMFFPLNVSFNNLAKPGLTAQTFFVSSDWKQLRAALVPGDIVLISFAPFAQDLSLSSVSFGASGAQGSKEKNNGKGKEMEQANGKKNQRALQQIYQQISRAKAVAVFVRPNNKGNSTAQPVKVNKSVVPAASTAVPLAPFSIEYLWPERSLERSAAGRKVVAAKLHHLHPVDSLPLSEALPMAKSVADSLKMMLPGLVPKQTSPAGEINVFDGADNIATGLKAEAALDFRKYAFLEVPGKAAWERQATVLRKQLMTLSGVEHDPKLDLDVHETGRIQKDGYHISTLYFQTRKGIYATADLYIPEGKGVFPAVINMHGHWPEGKAGDMVQACAISLAQNGYVCLNIDAWGAGERTTFQGKAEYHGSNLGASLMDIGETLLGNQVADNMRGVDLLCSLPFVDAKRIGATGASGGGNQTMWLSALDTRIKACMPVVSVGTFQSYIMGSNCVCELMPKGLTLTEEAGVLGLIAPRYLKIVSGLQDPSATFAPAQMLRSFEGAKKIYSAYRADGANGHIQYQLMNTPHGYFAETRSVMLAWFSKTLKNQDIGDFEAEKAPIQLLPPTQLLVFGSGTGEGRGKDGKVLMQRSPLITTTIRWDIKQGTALNEALLHKAASRKLDPDLKRQQLRALLLLPSHRDAAADTNWSTALSKPLSINRIGGGYYDGFQDKPINAASTSWQRGRILTRDHRVIPYRYLPPRHPGGSGGRLLLVCPPDSSENRATSTKGVQGYTDRYIAQNFDSLISSYAQRGDAVMVADLWGLGQGASALGRKVNGALPLLHTLARAEIWLGRTVMGEWVEDLNGLASFIQSELQPDLPSLAIDLAAGKELAVAALAGNAVFAHFKRLYLSHLPISYVVDQWDGMDYFNMGIHLPGILNWGNVSLMAALNKGAEIHLLEPVSMTGHPLNPAQKTIYIREFESINKACGQGSDVILQ